jgi:hypothetical protein
VGFVGLGFGVRGRRMGGGIRRLAS